MRLKVSRSKNSASLYVTKTVYEGKKEKTITVEKLGTEKELREKLGGADPYEWAKNYINELNEQEKENQREVIAKFSPVKRIEKNKKKLFNGGYLFLQNIYYDLKIDKICNDICKRYHFTFDLNEILSYLIYSRILFPCSKKATTELSQSFLEVPGFSLHQVYRALEVLAKEMDFIQAELYKNSLKILPRNSQILYYDCTNFFFEIEQEDGLKQYGVSKENRPNPIVQMGLFMDGNGIPLAFCINNGHTNEQITLKPLEKKIISDFELSEFVVCTDAGLASTANRQFNNFGNRSFVTTQSIKLQKKYLKEWCLNPEGWYLFGSAKTYNLNELDGENDKNKIYYKERWINENGLEQKLIVTYSIKNRNYQRHIRNEQIERAEKLIASSPKKINKKRQTDFKRFIEELHATSDGEVAEESLYSIDLNKVKAEEMYDGFYAICTNLEDETEKVIKINKRRWEVEESFRIMKSEMKSRPVYLTRDDRIIAHFGTCFISLLIYRILEKRLDDEHTCSNIIETLRSMNFNDLTGEGYIPVFERTDLTDSLHDIFGFRTDYQINSYKMMKKIYKQTKK
ncbi:transposase [Lachnospiraceae bacterium PM6-15]|uniref:IS1634 family transposase n=1 Tax=Ohessyouella blattaphilus TaxID=2949333 RepID=UPI003E309570